jgi:hypothetical protein
VVIQQPESPRLVIRISKEHKAAADAVCARWLVSCVPAPVEPLHGDSFESWCLELPASVAAVREISQLLVRLAASNEALEESARLLHERVMAAANRFGLAAQD